MIIIVIIFSAPLFSWDCVAAGACASQIEFDDLALKLFVVSNTSERPNADSLVE